ncbi:MAG: hypothetical protein AB8H03_11955 [Saprospiraceae bacterium]
MKIKLIIIGIFLVGFIFPTQAQTTKKNVVKTQVKQQERIKDGIKNGALTKGEIIRLQKQQASIQRTKRKAAVDGVVTRKEKAIIKTKQKKASKNITRKTHNNRS